MATKDANGKVIADKPTKSGYIPGTLYKKVSFKETDIQRKK